jgi:hypothetical protein
MKKVYINPYNIQLVASGIGFICGALMVLLDPWLRFPDLPTRPNLLEALVTAIIAGGYGLLLAGLVTFFWRKRSIWLMVILTAPILTGAVSLWNDLTSAFGIPSDPIYFFPIILLMHGIGVAMVLLLLEIARRLPSRRRLAYGAVPVVLLIILLFGVGRVRWQNQDAQDVMLAVNVYAQQLPLGEDYEIRYEGITYYSTGSAPRGRASVYGDDVTYTCIAQLFTTAIDVNCERED